MIHARAALDALGLVDDMGGAHRAGDGPGGAALGAAGAALALGGIHDVLDERLAHPGGAALLVDVGLELFPEMGEGGEHGVGGGLPQAAQGGLLDVVAQLLDGVQILRLAVALGDLGQQIQQPLGADAAGGALAAGLGTCCLPGYS